MISVVGPFKSGFLLARSRVGTVGCAGLWKAGGICRDLSQAKPPVGVRCVATPGQCSPTDCFTNALSRCLSSNQCFVQDIDHIFNI